MQDFCNIQRIKKTIDTPDKIEFSEILGQYSCAVAKAEMDVVSITMNLTKVGTNVVYGDYAYLTGYYDPNTSTLTGTWRPSWSLDPVPECVCAYGIVTFKFYKRNGEIVFNGTLGEGIKENGNYNSVDYWVGTKIQDI
jgi:hypothetical protein